MKKRDFLRFGELSSNQNFSIEELRKKLGDNPICYLTGEPIDLLERDEYTLDHIIPRAKGGKNTLDNLGILKREINTESCT